MRPRTAVVVAALAGVVAVGAAPAWATTVITMPACCATEEIAVGHAVFVLSQQLGGAERATLVRVDPANNSVTGELRLPPGTPTGNAWNAESMSVAANSIWIPLSSQNEVVRIDPDTMTVGARIRVGRAPASIVYDGSSIWVATQEDAAMARIDPALDAVVQTVRMGRSDGTDGPWQAAFDGSQILVSLPGSGRVAHLDPRRGRVVSYDAVGFDAAACAHILPAPGGYWLDDTECSTSYFRWDAATSQLTATVDSVPLHDFGAVISGGALYTGEYRCGPTRCFGGVLVKRDIDTGAILTQRHTGSDATLPHFAAGAFWVGNWNDGTVVRVARF